MFKKKNRAKVIITLVVIYGIVYALSNTLLYKFSNDTQNLKRDNQTLQEEIDLLQIQINTLNSREQILQSHEDMQIRDNVYYLDPEGNYDGKSSKTINYSRRV